MSRHIHSTSADKSTGEAVGVILETTYTRNFRVKEMESSHDKPESRHSCCSRHAYYTRDHDLRYLDWRRIVLIRIGLRCN